MYKTITLIVLFLFSTIAYSKGTNVFGLGIYDIKLDNINYKIPGFLVFKNYSNPDNNDIYNGLNFSRTLMENKFFIPNNINFPYSRKLLEKNFL